MSIDTLLDRLERWMSGGSWEDPELQAVTVRTPKHDDRWTVLLPVPAENRGRKLSGTITEIIRQAHAERIGLQDTLDRALWWFDNQLIVAGRPSNRTGKLTVRQTIWEISTMDPLSITLVLRPSSTPDDYDDPGPPSAEARQRFENAQRLRRRLVDLNHRRVKRTQFVAR
jgi:hypothetical protein